MADFKANGDIRDELLNVSLVCSFTSQLEPTSELRIRTRQYQEAIDREVEAREKKRLDAIYYGIDQQRRKHFNGAEISRKTLQSKCDDFFASLAQRKEKSTISRLRHHKSNPRDWISKEIKQNGLYTAEDVKVIVNKARGQWNDNTGVISRNFHAICDTLNGHKEIFQIFSRDNDYTSVLCGAISMIVQASVNHCTIAEQLSSHVTTLSKRILVYTQWANAFDKPEMQRHLSSIYAVFFDFFTEVACWYLKPWHSRFLDSFNSHCASKYKSAIDDINTSLNIMTEYGQTLMAQDIVEGRMELKAEAQRLGQRMRDLIEDNLEHLSESCLTQFDESLHE